MEDQNLYNELMDTYNDANDRMDAFFDGLTNEELLDLDEQLEEELSAYDEFHLLMRVREELLERQEIEAEKVETEEQEEE
jgi:hypothetical protein